MSPKNSSTDEIINYITNKVPGESKLFRSLDTVVNEEDSVHYPQEFLQSLNPSGLPPHNLELKVGVSIILLRNLSPPKLCNGTRLQVSSFRNNVIEAIILEKTCLPRIPMIPSDLPFSFKIIQFPVKIYFAITINM